MKRTTRSLVIALMVVAVATLTASAGDSSWFHVRVEGRSDASETVNINLPVQLVKSMLPAIQTDELRNGVLRISELDSDELDLVELLEAIRETPDAEFVRVRSDDENVTVSKQGEMLLVNVDSADGETVRVKFPMNVIDAMLTGQPGEIDLLAGLDALSRYGGDLVTVEGPNESVRIWIDNRETGE